jgi:hypothetical protein
VRVFLLHRDRDVAVKPQLRDAMFDAITSANLYAVSRVNRDRQRRPGLESVPPTSDDALAQDLELVTLWNAMAAGDEFVYEVVKRVVLSSLDDPDAIIYRQRVLSDCLEHPEVVRRLYELSIEALAAEREVLGLWHTAGPTSILHRAVQLLSRYFDVLRQLRQLADERAADFRSDGFARFFAMLAEQLDDDYLATVAAQLDELQFTRGVLQSAALGEGDRGRDFIVHSSPSARSWLARLPLVGDPKSEEYGFELHPRDDAGARALDQIRGHGLNHVADAVAQSADHVQSFFVMLRLELAFYLGCVNLHARLHRKREPTCFPDPLAAGRRALAARDIYDVCLSLHLDDRVVANVLDADDRSLVMITGANQGGKSTLLRSVGLAQLMLQSGMFVGARSLRASVCAGVFTHYKREEDATMERGKLDEELRRMSAIADQITPGAMLLCNESFASTNEREGSEIARQVIRAMLDRRIRIVFVTHMYDLAQGFYARRPDTTLFLRAEREPDGRRTFKLGAGEPEPTSYGEDSYRRIFDDPDAAAAQSRR